MSRDFLPLRAVSLSLFFIMLSSCRTGTQDTAALDASDLTIKFWTSCVARELEFSTEIEGDTRSRFSQTGPLKVTHEGTNAKEKIETVRSTKNSSGEAVIEVTSKSFILHFPKRWYGKSEDRLEKIDRKFGRELKEVVELKGPGGLSQVSWNYCSFESK